MDFDVPALVKFHGKKPNLFTEVFNTEKKLFALIQSKGVLNNEVHKLYHKACSEYENIILNNLQLIKLEEVEYFLWKLHYMHIEEFRKRIKQSSTDSWIERFTSFLSEATLFYENLIKKIRQNCGSDNKIEYVYHRFLICLGDISRYGELCKKSDTRNWSVASTYYFEAAKILPDSGNPHNQLALLATYVGDSFLALYHCIRSLAVKEPFPDAQKNLMLLIEENKSTNLNLLSSDTQVDFSRPYERIFIGTNHSLNNKESETDLWTFFIRMISFFLVKTSMDDFPCVLSSTMRELEALVSVNEEELQVSLESYKHIDPSKKGPYRAIQLVSIFIFVIHTLTCQKDSPLTELSIATTFLSIGRLMERCLKTRHPKLCPFLPCVLQFVEWLVNNLDTIQEYSQDERVKNTMSYFFYVLTHLLNRLYHGEGEISLDNTPLWEDHELQGFKPMAEIHMELNLDFAKNVKNEDRSSRIVKSAMKITKKTRKWIIYDEKEKKFCVPEQEEEEIIVFKPLTRHNSAPLSSLNGKEAFSNESLHRVTSLGIQKTPIKFHEPLFKDSTTCAIGPPSLNNWVLNQETPKFELSPIDELTPPLIDLSIYNEKHEDYVAPLPSAPLLPDDSVWLTENLPVSVRPMRSNDVSIPINGYSNYVTPYMGMSSSEWLYHYRNNHQIHHSHQTFPVHVNTNDLSSYGVYDQWGNYIVSENPVVYLDSIPTPVIYSPDVAQIGRSSPYGYLQYLKEREWQLQSESQIKGSTFYGK